MNHSPRLDAEKLVEIHKARDEWQGNLLIGYLRDNGVEATFQGDPSVDLDLAHMLKSTDEAFGVYVIEHDAGKARQLVDEFVATATDESVLDELAAQKLRVSKETITQLRDALKDERETFEFLGWIGVVFLGAAALLWIIWPAWLKMDAPPELFRWAMALLLALGAVFAGSWASRRL
jgi:hypothetical protein